MSRKNHKMINGKLLQTDKRFSQLKEKQKEKISNWLYDEYKRVYDRVGQPPDSRCNDKILDAAYAKIEEAEIWIPYDEVRKYFFSKNNAYRKRYDKAKTTESEDVFEEANHAGH